MDIQYISPDQVVWWQWGWVTINSTLVYTWLVMAILTVGSWLTTRRLSPARNISRWQHFAEVVVRYMSDQISEISQGRAGPYLPFVGTLFLFVGLSNLLAVVPGYTPPTASLSTTAALAICVFIAVPLYGVTSRGLVGYLRQYIRPSPLMLPMNILGEISRTLALAVRLFGNIMSGVKIAAILLAVAPFVFPIVMQVLGLLTGMIQAYIFAILAMVYVASAARVQDKSHEVKKPPWPEKELKHNG